MTDRTSMPRGAVAGTILAAIALGGCSPTSGQPAADRRPAVPVRIATAVRKTVPIEVRAIGNVEAYSTVLVKPRVEGQLERAHFGEGQDVAANDLLFSIDPRPFRATLRRAEANLARNQAEIGQAKSELERVTRLFADGLSSSEARDLAATNVQAIEAGLNADRAAVESAALDLEFCTIRSPISGRTGSMTVHEGNVVKANETTLVTIHQVTPIHVAFSVREGILGRVMTLTAAGPLRVLAGLRGDAGSTEEGLLSFVDNTVDRDTGTIRLKATFPNVAHRLWPGQFVDVSLVLGSDEDAVVIPSEAVGTSQAGDFVFVLSAETSTVELRPVVVARSAGHEAVLEAGVEAGEVVVIDGQKNLVPGSSVDVKDGEEETGGVAG